MEFVPIAVAIGLIISLGNLIKMAQAGQLNKVLTQLMIWTCGVLVVLLLANSDFSSGIDVVNTTLDKLNFWSLVLFGVSLAGTGGVIYDATGINTPSLGETDPLA